MDDLIADFVTETLDSIDLLDAEIVRLERDPTHAQAIEHVFRVVHTIKGTCGFLNLRRLERLAGAVEHLISPIRDGAPAGAQTVAGIFEALDRIRSVARGVGTMGVEPEGSDQDLLAITASDDSSSAQASGRSHTGDGFTSGTLVYQVLERPLRDGEASLDNLERAFQAAPGPEAVQELRTPNGTIEPVPAAAKARVRVAVDRLDHLMDMVSELVLVRNQLHELSRKDDSGLYKLPFQRLSHITGELQDGVMRTRMQPISMAWSGLPRIVRDLALGLGKQITLETQGDDTEIDRQLLEIIKDSLVHLVRNAADHGIEPPVERIAADKASTGLIRLSAGREGGQIVVRISDDGRGLDLERLRSHAVERGLLSDAEARLLTEGDSAKLIFRPGFSTASSVTDLSGRGVGLDAVRASVESAGGTIDLVNRPGFGLSVVVKLPLTLAIANVLIVEAGGQRYALPQLAVTELVRVSAEGDVRVENIGSLQMFRLRGGLLPLIRLDRLFGGPETTTGASVIAVCQSGHAHFGLALDAILQTEEIVVKPLPVKLRPISYFSGTTILGDGAVVLILEPMGFARTVDGTNKAFEHVRQPEAGETPPSAATRILVFRDWDGQEKAVPLAQITRLEEISPDAVEKAGDCDVVQYRNRTMHLVNLGGSKALPDGSGPLSVIVFSHGRQTVGLVVCEIVDVFEERLDLDLAHPGPGSLGTAVVDGRVMQVVDVSALIGPDMQGGMVEPSDTPARLILLEPSPFFQALLEPLLRARGYEVAISETVEAAQAVAARGGFAAAIVDLDTGPATSAAACAALRSDLAAPALVVGLATRAVAGSRLPDAAGGGCIVGKFDRRRLLDVLAESLPAMAHAA